MHHQSQLADLVDVLAVDFDIVDRLGDKTRREARRKTQSERLSIATKSLALGELSEWHPFLAID